MYYTVQKYPDDTNSEAEVAVRHGGRDLGVFSKAMTKECEISFWSDEHALN